LPIENALVSAYISAGSTALIAAPTLTHSNQSQHIGRPQPELRGSGQLPGNPGYSNDGDDPRLCLRQRPYKATQSVNKERKVDTVQHAGALKGSSFL
jgi:hypothetical protein